MPLSFSSIVFHQICSNGNILDLLNTLPKELCYNFLRTAGSSLGYKHTEDARAKISKAQTGTLNSMSGKISGNAMSINVYSLDNKLVRSYTSQVAAAKWLGVSNRTVSNYIKSGKVWNKLYTFRKS